MNEFERYGNLIVISGPSGVGKSTLVNRVRQELPDLQFSISCTTRSPRPGEMHGREYYFLTPEEFEAKVQAGEFLEYAGIFSRRYGTLKSEVLSRLEKGEQVLLDIDVQGAKQIRAAAEKSPELARSVRFVLIAPPSLETLEQRLRGRGSETEEQLQLRLGAAKAELSNYKIYDYIVVNDDLERAAGELTAVLRSFRNLTSTLKKELFQ
ncbi:MAG: guanylate kinase [Lentisphaeria bacterium]|nr:guanylate kinase [Lentisphaeria bacterium]